MKKKTLNRFRILLIICLVGISFILGMATQQLFIGKQWIRLNKPISSSTPQPINLEILQEKGPMMANGDAYHFAKNNRDFKKVPASELLSKTFSSSQGYQAIKRQIGVIDWPVLKSGGSCGA